jgi:hypothetical protein
MNALRKTVSHWLDTMFVGLLPDDQPSGTALAAALTLSFTPGNSKSCILYGAPKTAKTRDLLAAHGIKFEPREWIVDFVVLDCRTATCRMPVVACESEMHTNHGAGYSFGFCGEYPESGYAWDFCKLLHFPAPRLLFAARLSASRIATLEQSLRQCAMEYRRLWAKRRLSVVLFPSGQTQRSLVRIGEASTHSELRFEDLAQ